MEFVQRKVLNHVNSKIADELIADGLDRIKACYQCGTCTGGCPSGRRTAIRTRALIRRALLGDETVFESPDLWLCSTCYTCFERCPRKVPTTDVIIKLRNMAAQRHHMRQGHVDLSKVLINTGHGVPINDNTIKLREALGLPGKPPTTHSFPDAIKDIQTLVQSLGFDKLVGWEDPAIVAEREAAEKAAKEAAEAEAAAAAEAEGSEEPQEEE